MRVVSPAGRCVVDPVCPHVCPTRLRHERLRRGWGLRAVARQLAANATHMSRVERGIEGFSDARKVKCARLYGLSVERLFFDGIEEDAPVPVAS